MEKKKEKSVHRLRLERRAFRDESMSKKGKDKTKWKKRGKKKEIKKKGGN